MPRETEIPTRSDPATVPPERQLEAEPSLGELVRELTQESSTLIRQEVALARTEMRENLRRFGRDAAMLAAGGALLLVAGLVFTAFLVAALGDLLGDEYWLGALIVGVLYAAIGAAILMKGKRGLQEDDLKPERTIDSLQADKRWAQAEAQQVKRDLTS